MDDNRLIKYLLHESNDAEMLEVENWLHKHPDHQKKYEQIKFVWEKSKVISPENTIDEDQAWERFLEKRSASNEDNIETKTVNLVSYFSKAAIWLVMLTAGMWAYRTFLEPDNRFMSNILINTQEHAVSDTLFDGSVITVNKSSQLAFEQSILQKNRNAELINGEAFFQVHRNENRPFHVQAGEVMITVLGTEFNVKKTMDQVEVILESGSVSVEYENEIKILKPGETMLINPQKGLFTTTKTQDGLYRYYVDDYFTAKQTPLWRVVEVLNQAYNANIIILNENLRNLPLTTTFRNDSLENALNVLKETFGLTIIREPEQIIIK
ncbi:FecR domain-containing protein [Echinicola sp. CAU 1574]|uniref:FecR domain-containing protein n=1 Tax=Echinicola arenosa TaxID=2774144 RepID=A0ABR9AMC3_9BACT|nr:FecR domain-containing protein [Echinicola arenosa]MBD8489050.1 FecR domain-containing protein [Echinicola arenosa]